MKLISNEYRCSSLSLLEIELEVNELRGVGTDPLELLIRMEETEDGVRDEFLDSLFPVGG